jgi:hypothetical protein
VSQLVLPLLPLLLALLLWLVTLLLAAAAAVVESAGKLVAETAAGAVVVVVVVETVWWLSGRVQLETAVDEAAVVAVVDKESTCRSIVSLSHKKAARNIGTRLRKVFEFVHSGNEAAKICPVVSVTNRTVPPTRREKSCDSPTTRKEHCVEQILRYIEGAVPFRPCGLFVCMAYS